MIEQKDIQQFGDFLQYQALHRPDEVAYIFLENGEVESERVTYSQLDLKAKAISAYLRTYIPEGATVLLLFPQCIDYLAAFMGCLYAGVVAIPAYPPRNARHLPRLQAIIHDSDVSIVLTMNELEDNIVKLFSDTEDLRGVRIAAVESIGLDLAKEYKRSSATWDDLAFLQYTSGSTSAPKGVMLTHGNLSSNQLLLREWGTYNENTPAVSWLPLFHDMGLGLALLSITCGCRLTLMSPAAFIQKPARWLQAISHYKAHCSGGPNFAYQLCLDKITDDQLEGVDLGGWNMAFNGAEPVVAATLENFYQRFAKNGFRKTSLYPCYGLAEVTVASTASDFGCGYKSISVDKELLQENKVIPIDPAAEKSHVLVSSGRVYLDDVVYVVNLQKMQVATEEDVGEIWIKSPSVGVGYWQKEKATEETFRAYLTNGEGPFLRTGDYGFMRDGQLYVTGRLKDVIIIRGRNYYPQDLEYAIENMRFDQGLQSPVRSGFTTAFAVDKDGEEKVVLALEADRNYQRLCKKYEADENAFVDSEFPTPEVLLDRIRKTITEEFDVPLADVVILKVGSLPKTSSGKVQRQRTKMFYQNAELELIWLPQSVRADLVKSSLEASTESMDPLYLEILTKGRLIVAKQLNIMPNDLDVRKALNNYGVDSIAAIELAVEFKKQLRVEVDEYEILDGLSLQDLLQRPTLAEKFEVTSPAPNLQTEEIRSALSKGQESMWFIEEMSQQTKPYQLAFAFQIHSPVKVDLFRRALQQLADRHPMLRTHYSAEEGKPFQIIPVQADVDFIHETSASVEADIRRRLNQFAQSPISLKQGPLFSALMVTASEQSHYLVLRTHHIAVDLWSLVVLFDELTGLYAGHVSGNLIELDAIPLTYVDVVRQQQEYLASEKGKQDGQYWEDQLASAPKNLELPTDFRRPAAQTFNGSVIPFSISKEVSEQLKKIAASRKTTLFSMMLAAYQLFLFKYTHQTDFLVGSPVARRNKEGLEHVVGYFSEPVVLRARIAPDSQFTDLLEDAQATVIGALKHQDYPFGELVERLKAGRDTSRSPLFQAAFVLQRPQSMGQDISPLILGLEGGRMQAKGIEVSSVHLDHQVSLFDMTLTFLDTDDGLLAKWEYNSDLFTQETMQRWTDNLCKLVESIARNPQAPLRDLSLVSESERQQLHLLHAKVGGYESRELILDCFARAVAKQESATAVVFEQQRMSYGELDRRSNQLARYLRQQGVANGSLVALFLDRSVDMIVSLLAVLKAGAGYLPIDTIYPDDRVDFILEDAATPVVITQSHLTPRLAKFKGRLFRVDADLAQLDAYSADALLVDATSDSIAYVIYTSGSTGKPKGVLVSHSNLRRLFSATDPWFSFNHQDVWTLFHSFAFDFSVWEIWGALAFGGKLVVVPAQVAKSTDEFYQLLVTEKVTVLNQTPSAFYQLIQSDLTKKTNLSLRYVVFGGEALDLQALRPWFQLHGDSTPTLINMYGITETTVHVTYRPIGLQDLDKQLGSVIGVAIPDLQLHLLDQQQHPVPFGAIGEIYISGGGVAKGYLNRPELSAERFIENHLDEQPTKLYRSGDLARFTASGEMEYLGRIDNQVKIRGYRIELGDIESQINQQEYVHSCVVRAIDHPSQTKVLVAWVQFDGAKGLSTSEFQEFLKDLLPQYMIPTLFIAMEEFELTANGKVNTKALPIPEFTSDGNAFRAAETDVQQKLVYIWESIFNLKGIGVLDDFFNLGGHSLLATQLVARVAKEFSIELPVRTVFERPTILEMEKAVQLYRSVRRASSSLPDIIRQPASDVLKAAPAQHRLWFINKIIPNQATYNISFAVKLVGDLNQDAFARAVQICTQRHDILRAYFQEQDGIADLVIAKEIDPIEWIDMQSADQATISVAIDEEVRQGFDLNVAPLFRIKVLACGAQENTLVATLHHIISDGLSMNIFMDEVSTSYEKILRGDTLEVGEKPLQYADYVHWSEQVERQVDHQESRDYWENLLGKTEIPVLEFPTDFPRPAQQLHQGAMVEQAFDAALVKLVQSYAQEHRVSKFSTLLAGFKLLVSRYTGQQDILIGTPEANRRKPELEGIIGFFVNTLVLRTQIDELHEFNGLVKSIQKNLLEATDHSDVPFDQLVEKYEKTRSTSHHPIFQIMFGVQNASTEDVHLQGLVVEPLPLHNGSSKFDMNVAIVERGDALSMNIEYDTSLFKEESIVNLIRHYKHVLQLFLSEPNRRMFDVAILLEDEVAQIQQWNDTAKEYGDWKSLQEMFEHQVRKSPDAIALVCEEDQLTYAELNERANQLANDLMARGVSPQIPVGVCMTRSLEMTISLYGILKAGCAYMPIDPSLPANRIEYILANSETSFALVQPETKAILQEVNPSLHLLVVNPDYFEQCAAGKANPETNQDPTATAYVIYTSGSTGKPKGVMVPQEGIVNRLIWMQEAYQLTSDDTVLQKTPYGFDVSVWEFFWPLLYGAKLVMAKPDGHKDRDYLMQVIAQQQITTLHFVPSMLRMFLDGNPVKANLKLRRVICSGEALNYEDVQMFFDNFAEVELHNLYGPTEASVDVTWWQCTKGEASRRVPIGHPIANTTMHILDRFGHPVPIGVVGELYIGGVQLAKGYLARPDLTENAFVQRMVDGQSQRLYKTGDLGRYRSDGAIEYLGRVDFQVKLRGLRIELGEIEDVVLKYPGIRQCAVVPFGAGADMQLVAYLVSSLKADRIRFEEGCKLRDASGRIHDLTSVDLSQNSVGLTGLLALQTEGSPCEMLIPSIDSQSWMKCKFLWQNSQFAAVEFICAENGQTKVSAFLETLLGSKEFDQAEVRRIKSVGSRRRNVRLSFESKCTVVIENSVQVEIKTVDFSPHSIRFEDKNNRWKVGDSLSLTMNLPGVKDLLHHINGKVVWQSKQHVAVQLLPNQAEALLLYQTFNYLTQTNHVWINQYTLAKLKSFVQTHLPDYMVPSSFDLLEEFPLSDNGKMDRKALPKPSFSFGRGKAEVVHPVNEIQQSILQVWRSLLNKEPISIRDNFFEIGGHSLLLAQVFSRVQQEYHTQIEMRDFFENPTIEWLATSVEKGIEGGTGEKPASTFIPVASVKKKLKKRRA